MRIALINPPFLEKFSRSSRSPAVTKGGTIYYPMWLAYATGSLEKAGHECRLIDAPARNMPNKMVFGALKRFAPGLVVVDTATASIHNDIGFLEEAKRHVNCFAVLVGTHASACPEQTLKMGNGIDAVVRGEYDYVLRELAEKLEQKKDWRSVAGISYRKGNRVLHNKARAFIENLDELPFVSAVYKKHLNYRDYFYAANLYPEITIISGRGCPHSCTYCVLPQVMNGRAYRKRSVENLVREFEFIKENFPDAKEVFMEDDTFTADRERVRKFCDLMIEKKMGMTWSCNARADVDFETLRKMKKAGCRLLCVGFESGNQQVLNNIRKGTRIEAIRRFMKDSKKAGVLVHGCFMLGNQGETLETIRETIEFAKQLNPDTAQFFPIMVYPGTESYDWARDNGFLVSENFKDWLDERGQHNCMVSRQDLSSKELVKWCDEARREFYLRPGYVLRKLKQAFLHPREVPRLMKSGRTFYRYLFRL